jgi:receptor protein-tyrosine kinase
MLILAVVVVATAGGVAYSLIKSPVYTAPASMSFTAPDDVLGRVGSLVSPSFTPDKVAASNIGVITSPKVLRLAIRTLAGEGINIGLRPLRERLTAHLDPENNLVEVNATAATGPAAIMIANAVADAAATVQNETVRAQFGEQASALEDQLASLQKGTKSTADKTLAAREVELQSQIARLRGASLIAEVAQVVERAGGEIQPESPRPLRDIPLAAFLGLLLGIGAALVRESLDRRLHSAADIQRELELPVVGMVRTSAMGKAAFSTDGTKQLEDRDIEAYRILRNNLEFLDVDTQPRSVLVTSGLPEEGKSTVAASLAQTCAAAGVRTLLLECDLRRPTLPGRLGLNPEPGLTDYLVRRYDVSDVLQQVTGAVDTETAPGIEMGGHAPLTCVTAGSMSPRPAEALGSERFKEFLAESVQTYEMVVIDTSPLLSVVDTRELVSLVDAVLLCVRVSRTTRDQMVAAKATLDLFPPRPTGVVITAVRGAEEPDYGYYSYSY